MTIATTIILSISNLEVGLRWLHDRASGLPLAIELSIPFLESLKQTSDVMALELGLRWLHDRSNERHCTMGCMLEGYDTCLHYVSPQPTAGYR